MSFFDGLYSYEVILLVLGAFFFLVLTVAFVVLLAQGKPLSKLLMFFIIPLVMMGFPGIKSIQFQKGVVTIDTLTHDLQQHPADAAKRSELSQKVSEVASRPVTEPGAIASIASAQFALGDHKAAEANLQKVEQTAPNLPQVVELKKRINLDNALKKMVSQAEQHPNDATVKEDLRKTVDEAARLNTASPQLLTTIAKAQQTVGNQLAAVTYADKALAIDPNLAHAKQVKNEASRTKQ